MEIQYKREMRRNYLMIGPEPQTAGRRYESGMMIGNHIEGLLRFHMKQMDTQTYYCYEITSRQPMNRLLEQRTITLEEIRGLIVGIAGTLNRMEEYLLEEEQLLLDPPYIYVDPEDFSYSFCLVPGGRYNFSESLAGVLQYLLGKVDHQNKEAVVAAYGLYQESQKENYSIDDLLRVLSVQNKGEGESRKKDDETDNKRADKGLSREEREKLKEREIYRDLKNQKEEDRTKTLPAGQNKIGWSITIPTAIFVAGFAGIWLWRGTEAPLSIWAGLAVVTAAAAAAGRFLLTGKAADLPQENGLEWRMVFQEELDEENAPAFDEATDTPDFRERTAGNRRREEAEVFSQSKLEEAAKGGIEREAAGNMDTVLLKELDHDPAERRLISLDGQLEDIPIPYFPFIIGKQEELVDYRLAKNTVSRLHLRIDRVEGSYEITDLNTTNGTRIQGRMLEANETAAVMPGDEIYIADAGYRFI